MKRRVLAILIPPFAVCRYGCAGCCAGPIALFWVTGLVSLVYGFFGGPLELTTISWWTVGLGVVLWAIAAGWALITVHSVDEDQCARKKASPLCNGVNRPSPDQDPFDEIKKAG